MEDVSRIVGSVCVKWKDRDGNPKEYIVDNFGLRDWSALQSRMVEEKRSRMIQSVLSLRDVLPKSEFEQLKLDAIKESGNIAALNQRDFEEVMSTPHGAALMLWILLERKYPQQASRQECLDMVQQGAITEENLLLLLQQLLTAMGVSPAGNLTGQSNEKNAASSDQP